MHKLILIYTKNW